MAPSARGCRWLAGWKTTALMIVVANILLDDFASTSQADNQCVVADFDLCSCHSRGGSDDGIIVDCNTKSIPEVMEAIRASEEMRRRTVML